MADSNKDSINGDNLESDNEGNSVLYNCKDGRPIAVVIPGLTGGSESKYIK